jgi:CBS domain-containing protein
MLEADVHGLPVISEGGRLLGIVTISDVLKTLLGEQQVNRV